MTTEQYQIGYKAGYSDGFDAGAAGSQWRTIDSAPTDGQQILVWGRNLAHPFSVYRKANGLWVTPGKVLLNAESLTHWMPLPAVPKNAEVI